MAGMRVLINHRGAAAVAACLAAAVVAVWLLASGGRDRTLRRDVRTAAVSRAVVSPPRIPAASRSPNPRTLGAAIDRAQQVIDARSSPGAQLQAAGRFEQMAVVELERERAGRRRATLSRLSHSAAVAVGTALRADAALSALAIPERRLPPWRIIQPPPPPVLLGYFRAAQARYGVPWQDLAAIELVETHFGRIRGSSPAGAQGPMQFMPSTWASFGHGSIDDPRAAILAAARYLRSNGAPRDMRDALYHYNNSLDYVRAVSAYAAAMRADSRVFYGYYQWQVLYTYSGRTVLLPVGYPRARPVRLAAAEAQVAP